MLFCVICPNPVVVKQRRTVEAATINTPNIEGRSITAAENNRALWLIALRVFTHRGGHKTTDRVILRYDTASS